MTRSLSAALLMLLTTTSFAMSQEFESLPDSLTLAAERAGIAEADRQSTTGHFGRAFAVGATLGFLGPVLFGDLPGGLGAPVYFGAPFVIGATLPVGVGSVTASPKDNADFGLYGEGYQEVF